MLRPRVLLAAPEVPPERVVSTPGTPDTPGPGTAEDSDPDPGATGSEADTDAATEAESDAPTGRGPWRGAWWGPQGPRDSRLTEGLRRGREWGKQWSHKLEGAWERRGSWGHKWENKWGEKWGRSGADAGKGPDPGREARTGPEGGARQDPSGDGVRWVAMMRGARRTGDVLAAVHLVQVLPDGGRATPVERGAAEADRPTTPMARYR